MLEPIKENVPLSLYTTLKIGGNARYFCEPSTSEMVAEAVRFAWKNHLPFYILGGGSNLLVADSGFDGLVIRLERNYSGILWQGNKVRVKVGTPLMKLALETLKAGYGDLLFGSGIPGTVGGALRMNAGAYGGEISTCLDKVVLLDSHLNRLEWSKETVQFGYRTSSFQDEVLLEGVFTLREEADPELLLQRRRELIMKRQKTQPLHYPNAGSIFKNPESGPPAGFLIEEAGLKGYRRGDAKISEKHANFIVNLGQATARDVMALIELARDKVWERFGIALQLEIKLLGVF